MDSYQLKEYIIENNKVEFILQELGCQHIKYHSSTSGYWTCGNPPPSDNPQAITLYNNEFLNVVNYTKDMGERTDIFSLVGFINQCNFFESMLWCCNVLGLDYYHEVQQDLPESLRITKMLMKMKSNDEEEDDTPIRVLDERILNYYKPYVNDMFLKDGISYETQQEFEYGYDESTNRITLPIRSELGDLIGVKGRLFKEKLNEYDLKYLYIEPCNKSKVLYNIYKSHDYIKEKGYVFVGESEKFCAQLWSAGIKNSVAIAGHKLSKKQIELLSRLCVTIVICFDKDIIQSEIEKECDKFMDGLRVEYLLDVDGLLGEKEAPSDNIETFKKLIDNYKFLYKR